MQQEHYPVLWREALEWLAPKPGSVWVDVTCGLGGHTLLLAGLPETARVISLDRDAESLAKARARAEAAGVAERITFRQSPFSQLRATLAGLECGRVDGLLCDLGVSRWQLTDPERGFTFQQAGPLDMRMDRSQELTAADLVNRASELELSDLFYHYAEERRAPRKIAKALVRARPVRDTRHLAEIVASAVPRTGKLHPATRVFQALRMATNSEPEELDALLEQGPECVKPGGRWVVIAFQSLDDRKVKQAFQRLGRSGVARILTRHVVRPGEAEVRENAASRSAVLRALEMV
jgi:16S rRNA (cytosine1402-N4)-methyltransferase